MSFSNAVKKELSLTATDRDKRYTCLYGILLFCKQFSKDMINLQTESAGLAELYPKLVKEVFNGKVKIKYDEIQKNKGKKLYSFLIDDEKSMDKIMKLYKINPDKREVNPTNIAHNSVGLFTAGVFLSCGSINNPNKEYHLEFVIPTEQLYQDFSKILNSFGFALKMVRRKKDYVLYIKDSETIEDILTFMGAQQSTLDIMNIKILKDVRNRANRIANCDAANIDKVIAASTRQIDDIMLIEENIGLSNISPDLREVAELRLDNPELSLKEIGELMAKPLQRSGVNRRFQKIAKIAEKIRSKNMKDNKTED